ncbi:beta-lactamase family protein [Streptomyces sp. XM4193]|uniref:serine hydrolase domain-containing protein n=1 Tax=Streptomyces sp. XM4193 TaxID=2929782 RepID=UPI001FFC214D|nr:serine hydrolase domain-containing protein [Streptomyces sp. XM4193]MCK1799149.1 beta-lactamase family protein [Streptomyces sp. XM4193]
MCAAALAGVLAVSALDRAAGAEARDGLRDGLEQMVADGFPGAVAYVRDGTREERAASGLGDVERRVPAAIGDRFRIASNTKAFVSTVLLQLEGEGRLSLADSVERWLPGTVVGNGYRGAEISLRQLLNHTSGVHDPTTEAEFFAPYLQDGDRDRVISPREVIRRAVEHGPDFAPGERWGYSNTNYLLAGLVIEAVTGRSAPEEIDLRIVQPLGLDGTYFPVSESSVAGRHLRGYDLDGQDMTRFSTSYDWTAGAMVSTVDDLARFHRALFGGELLPERQQRALLETVRLPDAPRYGLGVQRIEVPCEDGDPDGDGSGADGRSVEAWMTDGGGPGYTSVAVGSADGRRQLVLVGNVFDLAEELAGRAPVPRSEAVARLQRAALCG